MFAQNKHLYLIEQVQELKEGVRSGTNNIDLSYNHPCKELIWVIRSANNSCFEFVDANGRNPLTSALIKLNGHDRLSERMGNYFNLVQPFAHHTRIPIDTGINVFSFGMRPEKLHPMGTCNMSRMDNSQLIMNSSESGTLYVWATNYNVLKIAGGMGGVLFSN